MTTPRFIWNDIYHKPSDGCVINDYIQDIMITSKKDDKNKALLSFTTNITYQNTDDLVVDGKSYADFHSVNLYEEVILDDIEDIAKEFKNKVKEEVTTDDWIDIIVPVNISTYSYNEPECNVFDDDDNFIENMNTALYQRDRIYDYFYERGLPAIKETRFATNLVAYIHINVRKVKDERSI